MKRAMKLLQEHFIISNYTYAPAYKQLEQSTSNLKKGVEEHEVEQRNPTFC